MPARIADVVLAFLWNKGQAARAKMDCGRVYFCMGKGARRKIKRERSLCAKLNVLLSY